MRPAAYGVGVIEVVTGEQRQGDEALQCGAEVAPDHRREPVDLARE